MSSNLVECLICHQKMNAINNTHLKKHNITVKDYKELFPTAQIMSEELLNTYSINATKQNVSRKNVPRTVEERKNISKSLQGRKGHIPSPENHRKAVEAAAQTNKEYKEKHGHGRNAGRKRSDETRNKIKIARANQIVNSETAKKATETKSQPGGYFEQKKSKTVQRYLDKLFDSNLELLNSPMEDPWQLRCTVDHHTFLKPITVFENYEQNHKGCLAYQICDVCLERPFMALLEELHVRPLSDIKNEKISFQCLNCNHIFTRKRTTVKYNKKVREEKRLCPHCHPTKQYNRSAGEIELFDYICSLTPSMVVSNTKAVLEDGTELDIFLPEQMLAFEYCGLFWHGEKNKNQFAHQTKFFEAQRVGVDLVTIFEDDWNLKKPIVKAKIKERLGIFDQHINISHCRIVELDHRTAMEFYSSNHIDNFKSSKYHFGLVFENTIVAAISFTQNNIIQHANKINHSIDYFDLMVAHYLDDYKITNIMIEQNLCWNRSYEKFEFVLHSEPQCFYFEGNNGTVRMKALENGTKIWDCGYAVWKLK